MRIQLSLILWLSSFNLVAQDVSYNIVRDTIIQIGITSVMDSVFPRDTVIQTCTLSSGVVQDGRRVGEWTINSCDKEQIKSYSGRVRELPSVIAHYTQGTLDGEVTSFYPDSSLKSSFNFADGVLQGPFNCYGENGKVLFSGSINPEDKEYTTGKEFYSSGSFKRERRFMIESLLKEWMNEVE